LFIEALIIGLIIGIIRDGRMQNLGEFRIRGVAILIISVILQFVPYLFMQFGWFKDQLALFPFIGIALVGFVAVINIDQPGFKMLSLGALLNIVAMAMNNFLMPISISGLTEIGKTDFATTIADGSILSMVDVATVSDFSQYVSKIIVIPEIYPFASVISIGDIFISLGIILFVQGAMTSRKLSRRRKTTKVRFY